jgi:hypothetical protein
MKIKCYTLFDITKTNISNRRTSYNVQDSTLYVKQRNQQTNFETVLQIISMRSQPENITEPKKTLVSIRNDTRWGSQYTKQDNEVYIWSFSFTIHHSGVFNDGNNELGNLFSDCDGVPMLLRLDETVDQQSQINISLNLKNIHFEVERDE